MSGSGPMSAVRVVLFGHEIVHKVVHFVLRVADSRGIATTASVASTASVRIIIIIRVCTRTAREVRDYRVSVDRGPATEKNRLSLQTIVVKYAIDKHAYEMCIFSDTDTAFSPRSHRRDAPKNVMVLSSFLVKRLFVVKRVKCAYGVYDSNFAGRI